MEALGRTRKSRAVQAVVNSLGRGGNWGRGELCIVITLQIHNTQTCTFSNTSPYNTSITPHAQQYFQVKARDQKQKTAFQIFHFICKDKRRKIEMITFFFFLPIWLTHVCLFQYFTTYLYEITLLDFFLASHRLSLMLDNSKKLAYCTSSSYTQTWTSSCTSGR